MNKNSFTDVKFDPREQNKSVQWYQQQIRKLGTTNGNKIMAERKYLVNTIIPGKMYLFFYDPKHKKTLPYYDTFPLVLPFRKVQEGFYGLNLHYLQYMTRFRLLGHLFEYINNDAMDETTKLQISWRILTSSSKLAPVKACVKHYLFSHVESRFFEIPISSWITAALLPIDKFEKSNKQSVWNDSRKKY